jgi:glycosyltransferase involved in cell wall biosynthesis
MRHWPITRIPHVVDCDVFAPMDMNEARTKLGLPIGVPLILFLASAGIHDRRKGWDLLDEALVHVRRSVPEVEVVIVGPSSPDYECTSGAKIHWRGSIRGDEALRLHYCAGNITAVPSREDNMPLTAMEAQSCGRPVTGYALGGLLDIVAAGQVPTLAQPLLPEALATKIDLLLGSQEFSAKAAEMARDHSVTTWSAPVVTKAYLRLYSSLQR